MRRAVIVAGRMGDRDRPGTALESLARRGPGAAWRLEVFTG